MFTGAFRVSKYRLAACKSSRFVVKLVSQKLPSLFPSPRKSYLKTDQPKSANSRLIFTIAFRSLLHVKQCEKRIDPTGVCVGTSLMPDSTKPPEVGMEHRTECLVTNQLYLRVSRIIALSYRVLPLSNDLVHRSRCMRIEPTSFAARKEPLSPFPLDTASIV